MNFKRYLIAFSCVTLFYACSSDDTADIDMAQADCKIAQGLSPNQDGLNDNFDLTCLDDRSGIESLEIFDRNGREVFNLNNYRDEFEGLNNDGEELVTGNYFYVISFLTEDPEYGTRYEGSLYINVEQ